MSQNKDTFHSGFVTIVGKPNAGKSTLMNAMIGEKVAIVSSKPQTTRNKILGVITHENDQMVFVDTPGIHNPRTKLGTYMMKSVRDAMDGMDILVTVVDASFITKEDIAIAEEMSRKKVPSILVINKIDLVSHEKLLETIAKFSDMGFQQFIPISAKTKDGLDELVKAIRNLLPVGPKYFPEDTMTYQPERLIVAEIVREKALRHLRDEVPHGIGVEVLAMTQQDNGTMEIHANLYCERDAHKAIIIGKHGSMLQTIGSEARLDIEKLLDTHINLKLWVKVREDWRNRPEDLRNLGYTE